VSELTGKQRRHLRGLGHHLKPVLMVGREGLSEKGLQSADAYLRIHELLKLKVLDGCPLSVSEVVERLEQSLGAACAGKIGRTALIYRSADEPKIILP